MKRNLRGITAGLLACAMLLGGCSSPSASGKKEENPGVSETSADEVRRILCGGLPTERTDIPLYTLIDFEIGNRSAVIDLMRIIPDNGKNDQEIEEAFKKVYSIERKDGLIIVRESITDATPKKPPTEEDISGLVDQYVQAAAKNGFNIKKDISEKEVKQALEDLKTRVNSSAQETPVQENPKAAASGIRPEFQKMMDDYLTFFQTYADFMTRYKNSENPASMMTDYLSFLSQYSEMMESLDALDDQEMSSEETALYLQTTVKIQQIIAGAM